MTSEIILSIVIAVLLIERFVSNLSVQKERKEWMRGMLAKNLTDLTNNEIIEKQEPMKESPVSDVVQMDDLLDDEKLFDKHIEAVKAQAREEFEKTSKVDEI